MNYWLDKRANQTPAENNIKKLRKRTFIFRQNHIDKKKIDTKAFIERLKDQFRKQPIK